MNVAAPHAAALLGTGVAPEPHEPSTSAATHVSWSARFRR
jgi:hypothetical protein